MAILGFPSTSIIDSTSAGRALLTAANAAAQRTLLGLGTGDTPTFTALVLSGQSLTGSSSTSVFDASTTWNTTGTPTAWKLNITDTASNAASLLLDLRVGGISLFNVKKDGTTGIGTASPSQKLHVDGNIRVTGAYYDSTNSAGTSGQVLKSTATGTDWVDPYDLVGVNADYVKGVEGNRFVENLQTGVLYGGVITVNALDNSKVDISAGVGVIVSPGASTTALPVPTVTTVTWTAKTAVTLTYLATSEVTWFSINSSGNVVQSSSAWSDSGYQTGLPLGIAVHPNNTSISFAKPATHLSYGQATLVDPFVRAFGPLKLSGNTISAYSTNLQISRSAGTSYSIGSNYLNDPNNPNIVSDTNANPISAVHYYFKNGSGGFNIQIGSLVDPTKYDNGSGTLQTVSGGKYTIQRIFSCPTQPTLIGIYYGGEEYTSIEVAEANIPYEVFSESDLTSNQGVFCGYLIVKGNTTNLSNTAEAKFIQAGLFRSISTVTAGGQAITSLDDLTDVVITSPVQGNFLRYNAANSSWVNGTGVDGTGTTNYVPKWSDSDTLANSLIFDNGTNVGIGTASPTSKLTIDSGDIAFTTNGQYGLRWPAGSRLYEQTVATGGVERMLYQPNGDRFEVLTENGASFIAGFHGVNSGLANSIRLYRGTIVGSTYASNNSLSPPVDGLIVQGNVGIGTDSPSDKLHVVAGDASSVATAKIENTANFTGANDVAVLFTTGKNSGGTTVQGVFGVNTAWTTAAVGGIRIGSTSNHVLSLGTNNAERVRIDTSGNVGIGTTSPSQKLSVAGNVLIGTEGSTRVFLGGAGGSITVAEYFSTEANPRWVIGRDVLGGGSPGIGFSDTINTIAVGGSAVGQPFSSARTLAFYTSNATALTERMRIDSSGNVVVGTTSASARLHTRGSTAAAGANAFIVENSTPSTLFFIENNGVIGIGNDTQRSVIYPYSTSGGLAGLGALALTGDLGIAVSSRRASGGTTPGGVFLVTRENSSTATSGSDVLFVVGHKPTLGFAPTSGTTTFTAALIYPIINQAGGANGISRGLYVNPTLTNAIDWRSVETSNNTGWAFYGAGTANSYFGGNVGIGNAAPSYALDISGTTPAIRVNNAAGNQRILVGSDGAGSFVGTFSNNDLRFFTNSAEVARITAAGNVGIGTTSPLARLHSTNAIIGRTYHSAPIYSFSTGILIATDIAVGDDEMVQLLIDGHSYDPSKGPTIARLQCYNYVTGGGTTIFQPVFTSTDPNLSIDVFHYNGFLYFWFAQTGSFQTYSFRLITALRPSAKTLTAITNAAKPTSGVTNSVTLTPIKLWTSTNDGASSGMDADLLDGQHGSYYATAASISGTTNYLSKFTSATAVGNSQIFDNGTNVGIGTTSPVDKLHIAGGGNAVYLQIQNTDTSTPSRAGIKFTNKYAGNDYYGYIYADWVSEGIVFQANRDLTNSQGGFNWLNAAGTTQMVLRTNSGNLGIGTTTPTEKLEISNAIKVGTNASQVSIVWPNGGALRTGSAGTIVYWDVGELVVREGNAVSAGAKLTVRGTALIGEGSGRTADLTLNNNLTATTFHAYNTYTDASNYERAKIAWSSNVLQIGTEKLGTGVARGVAIQVDGTTRIDIPTSGDIYLTPVGTTDSFRFGPNGFKYLTSGGVISPVTFTMAQISLPYSNVAVGGTAGASTNSPSFSVTRTQTADVAASITNFITTFNTPASSVQAQNSVTVSTTVNQGAGSTGITRGIWVNPTLTAAADWRSIETSNNTGYAFYAAGTAVSYFGGRVGIGATVPSNALQVDVTVDASDGIYVRNQSTGVSAFSYVAAANNNSDQVAIRAYGSNHSIWPNTGFINSSAGLSNGLVFWQAGNAPFRFFTNSSERLRIDGAGNVGIGTISPSTLFEVSGANGSNIIRSTTTSNLGTTAWAGVTAHDIQFYNADPSGAGIYSAIRVIGGPNSGNPSAGTAEYDFTVWTGGYNKTLTERLRITSNGDVGIGTISPAPNGFFASGKTLHISQTTSPQYPNIRFTTTNNDSSIGVDDTFAYLVTNKGWRIYTGAGPTEVMRVGSDGNVGIGATPTCKLDVAGTIEIKNGINAQSFRVYNTYTDASNYERAKFAWSSNVLQIGTEKLGTGVARAFALQTDGTNRMLISATGNVGINTSTIRGRLDVYGLDSEVFIGNDDSQSLVIGNSRRLNYGDLLIAKNLAGVAASDSYRTVFNSAATGYCGIELRYPGDIAFYGQNGATTSGATVTPTTRMMIKGDTGNVGIGTASPLARLNVSSSINTVVEPVLGAATNSTAIFANSANAYGLNIVVSGSGVVYLQNQRFDTLTTTYPIIINGYGGNVGIGVTNPSQTLHVSGNVRVTGAYYDSNNSSGTSGQILASTGTGTDWVTLSEITGVDGSGTLNYITKWTPDGNTIGNSQIFDDGTNVGIGTASPSEKFQIVNGNILLSATYGIRCPDNFRLYDTTNSIDRFLFSSNNFYNTRSGGEHRFQINGSQVVVINSSGNVGIGTTSPLYPLDVRKTNQYSAMIHFNGGATPTDAGGYLWSYADDMATLAAGSVYDTSGNLTAKATTASDLYMYQGRVSFRSNTGLTVGASYTPTTRFTIAPDGSTGIGSNWAKGEKCYVAGGALILDNNQSIKFVDSTDNNRRVVLVSSANDCHFGPVDSGWGATTYLKAGGSIVFTVNQGSPSVHFMNSGRVGIGTSGPQAKLQIVDTVESGSGSLAVGILDLAQTWNTTGTPTAIKLNVTDTASNANSILMDLQVGGSSRFKVEKSGSAVVTTNLYVFGTGDADVNRSGLSHQSSGTKLGLLVNGLFRATASSVGIVVRNDGGYGFSPDGNASNTPDTLLNRDAAGALAQRNGVNSQIFRVYNTYTDASNYERGKFAWSSNVLQIGTEKLGTGVARALEIQTDGTTRITVAATGAVTFASAATFTSIAVTASSLISYDSGTLATTTATSITTFAAATYGSAEYLVQVRDTVTGQRQVSKILIVHDGTTAYSTEYGVVFTGTAALATFTVDISGGNVRLLAAGASANSTEYKILKTNLVV